MLVRQWPPLPNQLDSEGVSEKGTFQFFPAVERATDRGDLMAQELVGEHLALPQVRGDHDHPVNDQNPTQLTEDGPQMRPRNVLQRVEEDRGRARPGSAGKGAQVGT